MSLIKGTIPVVDEYLIKAVKYALDQMGIHPDNLPQKKRRTSLDGVGYGGSGGYENFFAVQFSETGVRICDGGKPGSEYCGLTDLGLVMCSELETGGMRYVCLRLTGEDNAYSHTFEMMNSTPDEREPVVILAEIDGSRIIQRWTGGKINWRDRFIIPFLR